MSLLSLFIGLVVGAIIGIFLVSIVACEPDNREEMLESYKRGFRDGLRKGRQFK